MAKYIVSPQANIDIAEILEYIAQDDVNAAISVHEGFLIVFQMLANNPKGGRVRDDLNAGLRSFPNGRYIIFYRIIRADVEIARVLHSAREIETLFEQ